MDSGKINKNADYIDESLINISMLFRTICRNCDKNLRYEINKWINRLTKNRDYNNIYLDDILETSKMILNKDY